MAPPRPATATATFFQQQESARRSSRRLLLLFALAVLAIIVAVNAALAGVIIGAFTPPGAWARYGFGVLPHYFFETTTGVLLLMIVGGTVVQILDLRAGGEAVARMVGARPVDPGTRAPLERRLLNIIEEMALASGIAAPRAYVLDRESGINAFAAGLQTSDAIVAVTQGALTRLTRDELQGVIGHEFSHILNGDMGLNLRLIGVLQGLLVMALFGRFLMSISQTNERRESSPTALIAIAGVVVLAIGYIGVFFGRLIKAGVSRQREFLADASSVQFTRNPDGIGGALRKIGGLGEQAGGAVQHIQAETLSHMFMAPVSVSLASGLLASHPPLRERLSRIYGGRPVEFIEPSDLPPDAVEPVPPLAELEPLEFVPSALAPGVATAISPLASAPSAARSARTSVPIADSLHASIGRPAARDTAFVAGVAGQIDALQLRPALSDPTQAQLLALAMLLDKDQGVLARQRAAVAAEFAAAGAEQMERFAAIIVGLPPGWRLPLLDLSMPALRTLAPPERDALLRLAHVLIQADGRVTLAEFLLFSLLQRRLQPARAVNGPGRALRLQDVGAEAAVVLSLIASLRMPQEPRRAFDAGFALLPASGAMLQRSDLTLARLSAAFDRLALLAPLQKPLLIKACIAAAFVDGHPPWTALSGLRTLCAALDCPLPPQVEAAEG